MNDTSISEKEPIALRQAMFLRFYGDDFKPKERKKILLALRKAGEHDGKAREKGKEEARKIFKP